METTFETIISQLKNIGFADLTTLNNLMPKVFEFLRRTIPDECNSIIDEINNITFNPSATAKSGYAPERWNSGIARFLGLIEAKKETYEWNLNNTSSGKKSVQNLELEIGVLRSTLSSKQNDYQQKVAELNNTIISKDEEISNANKLVNNQKKEIEGKNQLLVIRDAELSSQKFRVKKFNIAYFGLIAAVAGVVLYIGYFWGNNRFDSEKLIMRDNLKLYSASIDSLQTENLSIKNENEYLKNPERKKGKYYIGNFNPTDTSKIDTTKK